MIEWANQNDPRGEFCLVVEGNSEEQFEETDVWWSNMEILPHVDHYIHEKGLASKDAIKQVAKDRNVPKRDVY